MAEALSYQTIRSANQAREADELKTESRKKNLLILVLHYLNEEGYLESAQTLEKETNLDLNKYEVCDNVDLSTVLMEYESYYYIKFSRYPKITKKLTQAVEKKPPVNRKSKASRSSSTPQLPKIQQNGQQAANEGRPKSGAASAGRRPVSQGGSKRDGKHQGTNGLGPPAENTDQLALQGLVIHGSNSSSDLYQQQQTPQNKGKVGQIIDIRSMINDATRMNAEEGMDSSDRMLKPLGGYVGYSSELRELAQVISRDIFMQNPNVRWNDIIGLDAAKRLVKEAVVYPIKYPQLFTGILSPWKGLLLYGPPGTGKTLLAKAVATECNTTFFNISASSIVSKWRGDSEKLVRVLFEMARFHAPSTIFLDELESLMSQRGSQGGSSEHEGSRRMKTELLVQMDGLAKSDDLVFLLAASNLPWELDHAMLRRLEKRILVDLPTPEARRTMVHHYLPPVVCAEQSGLVLTSDLDYDHIAKITEGYSGSDLRLVCKEAAMRTVRKIFDALENHTEGEELHVKLDTITTQDVEQALQHTKPSARLLKDKYAAWQKEYESV